MSDSDRRVVGKPMVVQGGMTATPEGIAELERQRARVERAAQPEPTTPFSAHLKKGRDAKSAEAVLSEKEKKKQALPKKGPKPGMVHPAQRDVYGRDEESEDAIVLKG
jgi:hypothetical protein